MQLRNGTAYTLTTATATVSETENVGSTKRTTRNSRAAAEAAAEAEVSNVPPAVRSKKSDKKKKAKKAKKAKQTAHAKAVDDFNNTIRELFVQFSEFTEIANESTNSPVEYDPHMQKIRVLTKIFEVLNDPIYEKVIRDPKMQKFITATKDKCPQFKEEATEIIETRKMAVTDLRNKMMKNLKPGTRGNKNMLEKLSNGHTYYENFYQHLNEEMEKFLESAESIEATETTQST